MGEIESPQLHVVMFPYFAFGHISPFVQLSNKFSSHGIRVSFFSISANISKIKSLLLSTPLIEIIPLQIPQVEGISANTAGTSEIQPSQLPNLNQACDLMQPQIKLILSDLKPHFVIFDFAQYWLPSIASELGIKTLFFSVFSAISGAYLTVPARLNGVKEDEEVTVGDLMKPPPGFPSKSKARLKTFEAQNLLFLFKRFNGDLRGFDRVIAGINGCSAIIMKSCSEIEGPYLDFMKTQFEKPLLLVGPLVPEPPTGIFEEKWEKWLSKFQPKSVIFCSFGSETFLEDEQIRELASGLELTGLPFILVMNFPKDTDAMAKLQNVLPEGFSERVKNRGIVHTGWVQQQLLLANTSVGCFLCHSGFSSIVEALVSDCQLVLLPFKGDQFLNAKLITYDLEAGVEVNRRDEDGYFGKDDIYEAVKVVMVDVEEEPGKSIRANQKKWSEYLNHKEAHDQFISDMVSELKAMAYLE